MQIYGKTEADVSNIPFIFHVSHLQMSIKGDKIPYDVVKNKDNNIARLVETYRFVGGVVCKSIVRKHEPTLFPTLVVSPAEIIRSVELTLVTTFKRRSAHFCCNSPPWEDEITL